MSQPYANLVHDAQIYAFQVLNRAHDGSLASDLFLKFGSQDRYTPFSMLAAPLARLAGVEWTFFILFLASNALLVLALDRLVTRLIDEPALRTATSLFVVVSSMPYAGLSVFFVRESFFTPRMIASALAVFALGCALTKRYAAGLVLGGLATVMHPLMGAPATLVVAAAAATDRLPRQVFAFLVVGVAAFGGASVLYRPLGYALFGLMDMEWLDLVRHASPYVVLEGWSTADWTRLVAAVVVVVSAAGVGRANHPGRSAMLLWTAIVAVMGLLATAIAIGFGYRLLIQAQPYRAVWLLHLLQIPAVVLVARATAQRGGWGWVAAAAAGSTLIVMDFVVYELIFTGIVLAAFAIAQPRVRAGRDPAAVAVALLLSVLAGVALWGGVKLVFAVYRMVDVVTVAGVPLYVKTLVGCVPRVVSFAVMAIALAWCVERMRSRALMVGAIVLAILPHLIAFTVHAVPAARERTEPHAEDVAFVRRFLESRFGPSSPPPTIYAGPWGDLGLVWLGLRARNYFSAVVVIFDRDTAFETLRRAGIVRPFELERYRAMGDLVPPVARPLVAYLFRPQAPTGPPTRKDLARLCAPEEDVDVVVLARNVDDALASSSNGRVFVYECARVGGKASRRPALAAIFAPENGRAAQPVR